MWRGMRLATMVISAALVVGCTGSGAPPSASSAAGSPSASAAASAAASPTERPLRDATFSILSPNVQPAIMQLWIGEQLGYFAEHGIRPQFLVGDGFSDSLARLVLKQTDVGLGTLEGLFALQQQNAPETDEVKLFYLYQVTNVYRVASAVGSDITEIADLEGKKIGVVNFADSGYPYVRAMLESIGINPDSAEYVALGAGPAMIEALEKGEVDAVSTFSSLINIWETQGYKVQYLPPTDERIAQIGNVGLMGRTEQFGDPEDRDLLVNWAQVVAKSTIFAIENPEVGCRLFFEMYPETLTAGKSYADNLKDCRYIWEQRNPQYDIHEAGIDKWGLMQPEKFQQYAEMLGIADKVDVNAFHTNELIDDINAGIDEEAIREAARTFCDDPANQELCDRS